MAAVHTINGNLTKWPDVVHKALGAQIKNATLLSRIFPKQTTKPVMKMIPYVKGCK